MRGKVFTLIQRGIGFIVTFQLGFSPAFAATLELTTDYKVRTPIHVPGTQKTEMARVGLLKKGSLLEIPDEYVVLNGGKPDFEATLNKWIDESGKLLTSSVPMEAGYDGIRKDYFFPVKILKAAPGSSLGSLFRDSEIWIALKHIARQNGGLFVTSDVAVMSLPHPEEDPDETQAVTTCEDCKNVYAAFSYELESAFKAVQEATEKKTGQFERNANSIARDFKRHCGISYDEFTTKLRKGAREDAFMVELMLSILNNESAGAGLCNALNSDDSGGGSWGIFQINAKYAKHPSCKAIGNLEEKVFGQNRQRLEKGIAAATEEQKQFEKDYLDCREYLRDPVNNTKEAIRIMKNMEWALFKGPNPPFDEIQMTKADKMRLLVSAYNGGNQWVVNAKKDLEAFNARYGASFDPNKWSDLRIFYFRNFLSANSRSLFFGNSSRGRKSSYIVSNLAYTETIFPLGTNSMRTLSGLVALDPQDAVVAKNE